MPPCPHFDLKIVQRSKRQSAVAAAAYQSGERLFSEYDQKQKYQKKTLRGTRKREERAGCGERNSTEEKRCEDRGDGESMRAAAREIPQRKNAARIEETARARGLR